MKVTVVGAHGQIALLMHPILVSNGHMVRGIVRNPDHFKEVKEAGAEPVLCDIEKEEDISEAVGEADAVVFAAGAGPGSGVDRKWSVDRDGAIRLIHAAKKNGIQRYVMISAMKLEEPRGNEVFQAYLKAKLEAELALKESGLDYTIIRPGRLTYGLPTGHISLGKELESGDIPRPDVALTVSEILDTPETIGCQWDLTSGLLPVECAIEEALDEKTT